MSLLFWVFYKNLQGRVIMVEHKKLNDNCIATPKHEAFLNTESIPVLLVEDSETDAFIVRRILEQRMSKRCRFIHAFDIDQAEDILKNDTSIGIVLLDLGLPDSPGPRATYKTFEKYKDRLPIIILTSVEDHVTALDILETGALDFIYKHDILAKPESLPRAIEFAISRHHAITNGHRKLLADLHQKEDILQYMTGSYSVMQG